MWGFPGSSVVMNQPANVADTGLIPESGISPGTGNGRLIPESGRSAGIGKSSIVASILAWKTP